MKKQTKLTTEIKSSQTYNSVYWQSLKQLSSVAKIYWSRQIRRNRYRSNITLNAPETIAFHIKQKHGVSLGIKLTKYPGVSEFLFATRWDQYEHQIVILLKRFFFQY